MPTGYGPGSSLSRIASVAVAESGGVIVLPRLPAGSHGYDAAMDLTLSPAEEAFRDELREWLAANNPGREPAGDEAAFQFRLDWQRQLHDAGWAGVSWPKEYGGRGATLVEQAIFNEEVVRARTPSVANVLAPRDGRPDRHRARHRGAAKALPAADPVGRRDLVPGVLRAGRRLGPGVAEDARDAPRRRMGRDRAEGLDDVRASRQVVHAGGADRPGRAQAQGTQLLPDGHGAGRGAGPPAATDHRRVGVQRAVHRGGADPQREHDRRGGRGLGEWRSPRSCTSAPRWRSVFR